jgi:hypothetical protein
MLHGTPDSMTLSASVDPGCPTAWQRGGINHMIANVAKLGVNVLVGWGSGRRKILLRRGRAPGTIEIVTIKMTEADENGMQTFTLND